jgi:hypothetical protein
LGFARRKHNLTIQKKPGWPYCLPLSLAYHESSQSWRELLGQLKRLGLSGSPKLVIDRKRGGGHHPRADCSPNRARRPRGSKPFMVALAICISTSFCTPVAHETTMLVMGPRPIPFRALEILMRRT